MYKPQFDEDRKGNSGVPNEPETRAIWTNASDNYTPYVLNEYGRSLKQSEKKFEGDKVSLWRWREDFQNC